MDLPTQQTVFLFFSVYLFISFFDPSYLVSFFYSSFPLSLCLLFFSIPTHAGEGQWYSGVSPDSQPGTPPSEVCIKPCYYGTAPIPHHPCPSVSSRSVHLYIPFLTAAALKQCRHTGSDHKPAQGLATFQSIPSPLITFHDTPRPDAGSLGAASSPPSPIHSRTRHHRRRISSDAIERPAPILVVRC
jgi:hypothetical protein